MEHRFEASARPPGLAIEDLNQETNGRASADRWADLVRRAAGAQCTILIQGETGAGKGHLARWIHDHSPRRHGPFIPVNCGAIPDSLIDSQLFGHVRGAFTGATENQSGLVGSAEHGTLFLDEVSDLPLPAQTRLLRLLQERESQPVGASRPRAADVRIIAATHACLRDLVVLRTFRADLLYRLEVIHLHLRPLRQRRDEIRPLAEQFNAEFAAMYARPPLRFAPQAWNLLHLYAWPGNVRELRTVIERLHVFCRDEPVTERHLLEVGGIGGVSRTAEPLARTLEQARTAAVQRVLAESRGSVVRAAEVFGVHRSTIYRWLQKNPLKKNNGSSR